jgi:cell division septum initiation protein DivIVA
VSIIDRISRKPRAEVTLPLAEWHATTLAIDGLVDHNDELQSRVDDLTLEVAEHCGTIARLTDERDRARRWAVHLEQDNADLERVNAELRQQLASAEVHGVPA